MRAVRLLETVLASSIHPAAAFGNFLAESLEPDVIHDARVATHRLRSILKSYASGLNREWYGLLRDRLEKLDEELSKVRDTDVLLERVEARAASLIGPERPRAESIVDICRQATIDARARFESVMREPWYAEIYEALAALREQFAGHESFEYVEIGKKKPARAFAKKLLKRTERKLDSAIEQYESEPTDARLHCVRIRAKHLRYLAESVAPLFGKRIRKLAKRAAKAQRILGEAHDAILAYERLRQLAQIAGSMGDPELIFVAGELAALEGACEAKARNAWDSLKEKLTR